MRVLIGALLLASLAHSKFLMSVDVLIDIGQHRERIVEIFDKVSTLSVFVKDRENPNGLLELLRGVFGCEGKSFAVYGFSHNESYREWKQHCRAFQNDTNSRMMYAERYYQKTHGPTSHDRKLDYFEDLEPHIKSNIDDSVDAQSPLASAPPRLPESFAVSRDRWLTFRKSGFVLLCTPDELELYLGCLLNRAGTFLFILAGNVNSERHQDISASFKKAWKTCANLKVFVLISGELLVLNPFGIDGHSERFGMLEKLPDAKVVRKLRSLSAHPMNVEIFNSAYSFPNGTKFTGGLDSFIGPDVEVARFIQEQMNVSSN